MKIIVGTVLVVLTASAFADPGGIIAALPDEAAECRYFTQLCQDARTARAAALTAEKKDAAAYAAWREASRASTLDGEAQLKAWERTDEAFKGAYGLWAKVHDEAVGADKVLSAKHTETPACLTACRDETKTPW